MAWDPQRYLTFGSERTRPAMDLLARVDHPHPRRVVDLGCGPGNSTVLLRARWPEAEITGVDGSETMLAQARAHADIRWEQGDLARWAPRERPDVIFSNAALQWLDDHATLLPRLLAAVAPGGRLAVQMPRNFQSPSHLAVHELLPGRPWASRLEPLVRVDPVADPETYYGILARHATALDIWQTEYLHVLGGENPVADWTSGSLLIPLLAALEEPERGQFEAEYRRLVQAAYPPEADGRTLYPFRRIFIVARM